MPRNKTVHSNNGSQSLESVKQFRAAAKAFTLRATESKETAMKTLIAEGIYTTKGKLSKNYR